MIRAQAIDMPSIKASSIIRPIADWIFRVEGLRTSAEILSIFDVRVDGELVKQFTIKPIAESMEDAKDRRQFITLNLAKNSFKVQMALRKS